MILMIVLKTVDSFIILVSFKFKFKGFIIFTGLVTPLAGKKFWGAGCK
jgi:hypothetical protein